MIADLDDGSDERLPDYDVCIVGSGPAGMTVAAELAARGVRLCVLESGKRQTARYADELRAVRSEGIAIKEYSRERVLGGTSTTWAGLSSPLDAVDMEPRDGVHAGWPLPRDELLGYYAEAAERYRFAPPSLYEEDGFGAVKARGDRRLEWDTIEEKVFLAASEPQDFGREHEHVFRQEGVDLYLDATLLGLEGANPRRAVVRTSGGRTVRVTARAYVLAAGGIENARLLLSSRDACPAGLGNEHDQVGRYLMNHPKNYHGIIRLARPVQELPYYFGCLFRGYAGYAGLRLSDEVLRERGLLNSYVRFEPLFPWSDNRGVESLVFFVKHSKGFYRRWKEGRGDTLVTLRDYSETGDDSDLQNERKSFLDLVKLAGSVAWNAPQVARYVYYRLRRGAAPDIHRVRLRNFMEMEPNPDNRVELTDDVDAYGQPVAVVRHQTSERDRRSLVELHEELAEEVARNGLGELSTALAEEPVWPIDLDASHHLGTTRMGTEPTSSVVDVNCRLHSAPDVYLAGGSVFPTSGCANPTLTIVALAIRLARHLADDVLGAPQPPASGIRGAEKRVLVVGAGGRVQEDLLPVLASLSGTWSVAGVFARSARTIRAAGEDHDVESLDALDAERLAGADLVYVAVSKGAVPKVLRRLASLDVSSTDVLVETPVVPFKAFAHAEVLGRFRRAWVAEDCIELPWFEAVRRAVEDGVCGALQEAIFDRSAYRYHGLAMIKTLLGSRRIRSARRRGGRVEVRLANGTRGVIVEPRDYAAGHFVLRGSRGVISDRPLADGESGAQLRLLVDGEVCRGFALGDVHTELAEAERALVGSARPGDSVTAHMDGLKRVGLRRLLVSLHAGGGAYPVDEGLDDMVVDYLLEKAKVYRANPLVGVKSRTGRAMLRTMSRVLSR